MNRPRLALACSLVLSLARPRARTTPRSRAESLIGASTRRSITRSWRASPSTNQRDFAGCYRLYQGALIGVEAVLSYRPELRQAVEKGLKDAEGARDDSQKAIELRRVLDEMLAGVRGMVPPPAPTPATTPPSAPAPSPGLDLDAALGPAGRRASGQGPCPRLCLAGGDRPGRRFHPGGQVQARRRGPGPVRKAPGRMNQLDERRPTQSTRAAA
jgi:hypothetical protein